MRIRNERSRWACDVFIYGALVQRHRAQAQALWLALTGKLKITPLIF